MAYLKGGRDGGDFSQQLTRDYSKNMGKVTDSAAYYKAVSTNEGAFDEYPVKRHHKLTETMQHHLGDRKMTDVFCSCVFLAFFVGIAFILVNALEFGDPRRLFHGFDYRGNLCGVDAGVASKNYLYWPDQNRLDVPVCVASCPQSRLETMHVPRESLITTRTQDYHKTEILRQNTSLMSYPTRKVGDRLCLPINGSSRLTNISKAIVAKEMYSPVTVVMDSLKDVCESWAVLFFMVPIAMAVGYIYMSLVRYCAKVVLLGFMVALISSFGSFAVYLSNLGEHEKNWANDVLGKYSDDPKNTVQLIMYCSLGASLFFVAVAGCVLYRIEKVAAVVQTAAECMWSIQLLLVMPVFEIAFKLMYAIAWIYGASYVLSNGDISGSHVVVGGHSLHGLVRTFHYTLGQIAMMILYGLAFLWGEEVISMVFKFAISYSVATWYFEPCRPDMSKPELKPETWKSGFYYAIFLHLGSLALGAAVLLILAIFVPFNLLLEWMISKTEGWENPCIKAIVYTCSCCTKCVQEVVASVNKGALVELVLRGDSDFFESAAVSVRMMKLAAMSDSFHRKGIVALHGVTFSFQVVGMVTSACAGGYATYWITGAVNIFSDPTSEYFLENRLSIVLVAAFISAAVSTVFVWTLDLVADTLLFCWLVEDEDEKMHSKFAPKHLRNLVFDDLALLSKQDKYSKENVHELRSDYSDPKSHSHNHGYR